ncbi:lytic murein transglycosylase [Thalassovita sp.]|uniref:lytic murein transglycosylase n=1 Tax=Thalassovita sp. TaxID=1979401 RepID=UPI002880E358|nr:lytic murein transglycosylase [Thalassovita sp.]MDF1802606.1 lytic murein transglycosylase [Thalassovita sp.]
MRIKTFLAAIVLFSLGSGVASASTVNESLRPQARPGTQVSVDDAGTDLGNSLRPKTRPDTKVASAGTPRISTSNMGFQRWIKRFRARANAAGISDRTLDRAFRGVRYNTDVIQRDRNQSEFTKTLWEYLDSAASDTRVANGKKALRTQGRTLRAIEAKYGVDKEVVAAVWGLESAYGTYRGKNDIIESLATLAYDGRRGRFFEAQLIAALKILQSGDVAPRNMTGSWAGAMGHTQFIPTSYLAFAVDFTGDGKRDIWSDNPADALASTAAYLKRHGWVTGQPWGIEVQLPQKFNYALANRKIKKSPAEWARLGIRDMKGRKVPNHGQASLLLPAGAQGAAFLIFKNFSVIERYNTADAYVIGVGHLSDRLKGGPKIQAKWPRGDRALTFRERKEMQRRLTRKGFDTKGVDGKIGPLTVDAVRRFQRSKGLTPDGYPSLSLLRKLRR